MRKKIRNTGELLVPVPVYDTGSLQDTPIVHESNSMRNP
jgi:hypothetical protein